MPHGKCQMAKGYLIGDNNVTAITLFFLGEGERERERSNYVDQNCLFLSIINIFFFISKQYYYFPKLGDNKFWMVIRKESIPLEFVTVTYF